VVNMGALMQMVKNAVGVGDSVGDIVGQIEAERAKLAASMQEIERLKAVRVGADSYEDASAAESRLGRVRWEVSRIDALLPQLESKLVAAKAIKHRDALAKHLAAARAMYPKLRAAVENAAAVQAEAIKLREDAERELGGGVVQQHIPIVAFRGLLLPDLVAMWRNEMDRTFAAPAPQPAVAAVVAPAKPAARRVAPTAPVEPVPPKPKRQPRRDKVAVGGRLVTILRNGVEIDGVQCVVDDQVAVTIAQADSLLRAGAAELVNS
jgi:hypothetical protein